MIGSNLSRFGEYSHSDTMLALFGRKIGSNFFLAVSEARPSTPTIVSVTTTDANWTALATGLTGVLKWRISELTGDDIHYAYVAAPGSNFSVGFGWVAWDTDISAIYIKRPAGNNITVKLEYWS